MIQRLLTIHCLTALLLIPAWSSADSPSGNQAPSVETLEGTNFNLSDLKGQIVLINFWASWCTPCREELPAMNQLWAQLRPYKLQMLAVNYGEDSTRVQAFTAQQKIDFKVLLDRNTRFASYWGVSAMPTTIVLNKNGDVIETIIGAKDWAQPEIVDKIRRLTLTP